MTSKNLNTLAVIALGMIVLTVVIYTRDEDRSIGFEKDSILIQGIDPAAISSIKVVKEKEQSTMELRDQSFAISEKSYYPASTKEINALIIKVLDIKCARKVTNSSANHEELGVGATPKNGSITFVDNEGKNIVELLVGKNVESGSGSYVRLGGKDDVYETRDSLYFGAAPNTYMDTKLLEVKKEDVTKVSVKREDAAYSIGRDKDKKIILENIPKGKRAKSSDVESVFDALSYLSFSDVKLADDIKVPWTSQYTCVTGKHLTYTIILGKLEKKHYAMLSVTGPSAELIRKSQTIAKDEAKEELAKKDAVLTAATTAQTFGKKHGKWVYELSEWKAKNLVKPFTELIEDIPSADDPEEIAASHILIGYKGSDRSEATRSKEDAEKLIKKILAECKAEGADFAALAKKYSEGPSKTKGGDLGTFKKNAMHKNFEAAAWKLKVGEISPVTETPFGYHIIKRTK